MQVMDLFELNNHFYNDDPDVPFWETCNNKENSSKFWMKKKEQVAIPQLRGHQNTEMTQLSTDNWIFKRYIQEEYTTIIKVEVNSQTIDYLCLKQAIISSDQTKKRSAIQSGRISFKLYAIVAEKRAVMN
ncbi:unnamed protein product (macronuclear) [Paramecium tetraurelia]|uniref:VASt domain-containing protein n=1 Tax=Paramecium tetraurelia TaxID=5888 RepID=A0BY70_PARTE|nr:uncharacterized protein GSPATT00033340001 [Paramecium tetraurelia]CAK63487.1 unnamed protein product [Paramecium tetraurelia]|eukprot:XP_001430885.1 hypothetical protein (macronuclear) [Paramecium tetraurelia strain d4-2]